MRVQAQSRAMPNVFNVGNVVKRLIWTRMSVGTLFVAGSVYAIAVCDRLRLPPMQRIAERRKRRHGNKGERSSLRHSHPVEAI